MESVTDKCLAHPEKLQYSHDRVRRGQITNMDINSCDAVEDRD